MTRGPRGEKRAIMSVWDDFIHRLEQDLAECRRDLELLESGQMQHRERRDGGAWVDTTQREIDWHKKTIGMYEGLIRIARNTENSQMASELAFGPQQSRRRMLHCDRLRSHAFVWPTGREYASRGSAA